MNENLKTNTGSVRQFSIANLAEWTVGVALVFALSASPSDLSILFTSLLVAAFVAYACWRMNLKPIPIGAITGFSWPFAVLFSFIVATVRRAEIVQGELYHEDGPGGFFFVCALLLIFFGGLFALLGAIAGAAVQYSAGYLQQD